MHPDPHAPAVFYATARGRLAARLISERLTKLWPPAAGMALLGLGFPSPDLHLWPAAGRCLAAAIAEPAGVAWPTDLPSRTCRVADAALPFPDLLFDRVLMVHGLELAGSGARLLREAWRVLKDDGRLIVVAPNRRGAWAYLESTPFGHGQPFSPGQLDRLLVGQAFRVERRDAALFVPPLPFGLVPPGARAGDALGRLLAPAFGGVTITEAVKDLFGAVPVAAARWSELPRRALVGAG